MEHMKDVLDIIKNNVIIKSNITDNTIVIK